jgi:hypothetical protein
VFRSDKESRIRYGDKWYAYEIVPNSVLACPSGGAVWGVGLQSIAGIAVSNPADGMDIPSVCVCVCVCVCVGSGVSDQLITHSEESYRVCV